MLLDELLWPDQPLGRDIAGSKETVTAITREMMWDYLSRQYRPHNAVISVAGDLVHQEVVEKLSQSFGGWAEGAVSPRHATRDEQPGPRLRIERRDTEQAHLALGLRGLSLFHPDRFVLDLLNVILGEGMSSRLFLQIRERRGLAYAIHSSASHFLDTGSLAVYAGVDPQQTYTAISAILEELSRLKEGVPESELAKGKEFTKGRLILRMEDSRSITGWLGGQELLKGHILELGEVLSIIDAITAQDLQRVAQELLVGDRLKLAVVGPVSGEEGLEGLLSL